MKLKNARIALSKISPCLTHCLLCLRAMHAIPNLKNPQTFNDKISWLKLYELPDNPLAVRVTDKFQVRDYVTEKGYGNILVKLHGVWNDPQSIDFSTLPERFAMKCNHGCGMNIICDDKRSLDIDSTRKLLSKWMATDWALLSAEPHYSKIKRKIICEEYVSGPLLDYKFFCFNGKLEYYYVSQGLEQGPANGKVSFFDMEGMLAPFKRLDHQELENANIPQPAFFDEMVRIARDLSMPFKFARIDFLTNENDFRFSEVTLTPCAGIMPFEPKEWDLKFGELLKL